MLLAFCEIQRYLMNFLDHHRDCHSLQATAWGGLEESRCRPRDSERSEEWQIPTGLAWKCSLGTRLIASAPLASDTSRSTPTVVPLRK